jgi:hypothetical protein
VASSRRATLYAKPLALMILIKPYIHVEPRRDSVRTDLRQAQARCRPRTRSPTKVPTSEVFFYGLFIVAQIESPARRRNSPPFLRAKSGYCDRARPYRCGSPPAICRDRRVTAARAEKAHYFCFAAKAVLE